MRILNLGLLAAAVLVSGSVSAQERGWASTPEGKARWNACYKETRLIYRTRNMSLADYRAEIKDARKGHMRICMTRVTPPAAIVVAVPTDKSPETALVSWAGSP
jgi:hypothetical protein